MLHTGSCPLRMILPAVGSWCDIESDVPTKLILLGGAAVLALIAVNAFFVAAEFAIVTVDRTRLRSVAESGDRRARVVEGLVERLSYSLSGVQLGITLCSLALGVLAEPVVATLLEPLVGSVVDERWSMWLSVALAIAVAAVAQMVAGEIIPKSVAVAKPLETARNTARPFASFMVVFRPFIAVSNALTSRIVRLLGVEPVEVLGSARTRDELRRMLDSSAESGSIDRDEAVLLARTFAFADKSAADALTPRVSIRALPRTASVGEMIRLSKESGFSRFPIIGEGLDDILGVVHIKDVLSIPPSEREDHPVEDLLRPVLVVPESKGLESLMFELQGADGQFAVVVDEYGGTEGIITLEDLVEEIVGDISDEHDHLDTMPTVRRWMGAHLLSGLLHPDEVETACGFEIPAGDYETLGGFVMAQLGRVPTCGDAFEFDSWAIEVTEMDGHRVATVKVVAPTPGTLGGP